MNTNKELTQLKKFLMEHGDKISGFVFICERPNPEAKDRTITKIYFKVPITPMLVTWGEFIKTIGMDLIYGPRKQEDTPQ